MYISVEICGLQKRKFDPQAEMISLKCRSLSEGMAQ